MKTNIKSMASFLAAAIWADGVYDEAEKITVNEIADALGLEGLDAAIETEIEVIADKDGKAVSEYLVEAAEGVDDEEIALVFESVMQMILADGVLSYAEAANLIVVAEALNLEPEYVLLMVADMVKEEADIEVSFD